MITSNNKQTIRFPWRLYDNYRDTRIFPMPVSVYFNSSHNSSPFRHYVEPPSLWPGARNVVISEYRSVFTSGQPHITNDGGPVSVYNGMEYMYGVGATDKVCCTIDLTTTKSMTGTEYDIYDPYLKRKNVLMPNNRTSSKLKCIGGFQVTAPFCVISPIDEFQVVTPRIRYKVIIMCDGPIRPVDIGCVIAGSSNDTCPDITIDGSSDLSEGAVEKWSGDQWYNNVTKSKDICIRQIATGGTGTFGAIVYYMVTGELAGDLHAPIYRSGSSLKQKIKNMWLSNPLIKLRTSDTSKSWGATLMSYTSAIYADNFRDNPE